MSLTAKEGTIDLASVDWLFRISPSMRESDPENKVTYVTSCAKSAPGWTEPPRFIYDHELVLFKGAEHMVMIGKEKFICPPDSFIIVPPGTTHSSANISKSTGMRYWSHFDWTYSGTYGETPLMTFLPGRPHTDLFRSPPAFVPRGIHCGRIENPARIYDSFERMIFIVKDPSPSRRATARAVLLEILLLLLNSTDPQKSQTSPRKETRMASVVRHEIEKSYEKGTYCSGIRALLSSLGMSYEHLCRIFRKEYGLAPLAYLNALKIGRAKLLLQDSSLTVSEIAYRVGFEKVSYFIQLFKKTTGTTPSGFRKINS